MTNETNFVKCIDEYNYGKHTKRAGLYRLRVTGPGKSLYIHGVGLLSGSVNANRRCARDFDLFDLAMSRDNAL